MAKRLAIGPLSRMSDTTAQHQSRAYVTATTQWDNQQWDNQQWDNQQIPESLGKSRSIGRYGSPAATIEKSRSRF
jgi:hypothetical protein